MLYIQTGGETESCPYGRKDLGDRTRLLLSLYELTWQEDFVILILILDYFNKSEYEKAKREK